MNYNLSPTKVYIYHRVSTPKQASDAACGLDIQTDICEKYSQDILKIPESCIDYYCDIGSSYNNKSTLPQLEKMVKSLVSNSVILIHDVSRLGRNTFQVFSVLRRVKRLNCKIISVKDNNIYGINRILDKHFYTKVVDAEFDSDMKSIKAITRIQQMRFNKMHIGRIPFGYTLANKKLVKNISEQNTIKTLVSKYKEFKSYKLVADHFNKTKMLYKGIPWTTKTVSYLINRDNLNKKFQSIEI
jgi:DNA invertase Pin-like site-specific DNA recombinase